MAKLLQKNHVLNFYLKKYKKKQNALYDLAFFFIKKNTKNIQKNIFYILHAS
jgi:hypothetical protein